MLAALFSGTRMTTLAPTTIRDQNAKHGPGKTIILHYTVIFGATLNEEGFKKRMKESWLELASYQTTSERLADQVRTIIKKGWFSVLKILQIHQKAKTQDITIPNTLSGAKQKQLIRNELPTLENEYATVPSNTTETLSQEQQYDNNWQCYQMLSAQNRIRSREWNTSIS